MATISSEYGYWPYVIAVCFFIFVAIVPFVIALICVARGVLLRRYVVLPKHLKVLSGTVAFGGTVLFIPIAFAAGFWVIHTAAAAMLCAVLWVLLSPVACLLAGPNVRFLLDPDAQTFGASPQRAAAARHVDDLTHHRSATAGGAANDAGGDSDLELDLLGPSYKIPAGVASTEFTGPPMLHQESPGGGGLRFVSSGSPTPSRSPATFQPPAAGSGPVLSQPQLQHPMSRQGSTGNVLEASASHSSGDAGPTAAVADNAATAPVPQTADTADAPSETPALRRFAMALWYDIRDRPIVQISAFLAGLFGAAMLILLLHNGCVCNKPQSMTTWASRSTKARLCLADGTACFTYVMLGSACTDLMAVSHYVVHDDFIPDRATALVCRRQPDSDSCDSAGWIEHLGSVRDNADLLEDERYIAHVPLTNLACGAAYNVRVIFSRTGTNAIAQGRQICTWTMPASAVAPAGSNGVAAFTFVGGGDYVPKSEGKDLLRLAMLRQPEASFAFIGGDLGYANNMRACYARVDLMLSEWLEALRRPADQCLVPLVTAIGNHDAGGYQWEGPDAYNTPAEREAHSSFYLKYYPSPSIPVAPGDPVGDWTRTMGSKLLGNVLGITTLDTGHVAALDGAQALYARNALTHFRDVLHVPALVMYHVPAYPSVRTSDGGGGKSAGVRDVIGPILDDFDNVVTLVLEHHDHAYKRTRRIRDGQVATNAAAATPQLRLSGRGVVYTGDGALGANDPTDDAEVPDGNGAVSRSTNYVLVAEVLSNGTVLASALDVNNATLDVFVAD